MTFYKTTNMFENLEPKFDLYSPFTLAFSMPNLGFGHLYFYQKDGKVYCSNELLSKEQVKEIFNTLIDQATFEE